MPFPYEYYEDNHAIEDSGINEEEELRSSQIFQTQWVVWRCVAGVMGAFFFAAAFVQHNDPDPYLWVPAYTVPCIVSWAVAFGLTMRKYKQLPSSPSLSSSSTEMALPSRTSSDKSKSHNKRSTCKVESDVVLITRYGSANTKLNWLINIHILYCFALGLWTLAVHLHGLQNGIVKTGAGETTTIFSHTLHMDAGTEEAKELMGLCLIIAWLSLLRRNNYVLLGKVGISLGISLTVIPVVAWIFVEIFEDSSCY